MLGKFYSNKAGKKKKLTPEVTANTQHQLRTYVPENISLK